MKIYITSRADTFLELVADQTQVEVAARVFALVLSGAPRGTGREDDKQRPPIRIESTASEVALTMLLHAAGEKWGAVSAIDAPILAKLGTPGGKSDLIRLGIAVTDVQLFEFAKAILYAEACLPARASKPG